MAAAASGSAVQALQERCRALALFLVGGSGGATDALSKRATLERCQALLSASSGKAPEETLNEALRFSAMTGAQVLAVLVDGFADGSAEGLEKLTAFEAGLSAVLRGHPEWAELTATQRIAQRCAQIAATVAQDDAGTGDASDALSQERLQLLLVHVSALKSKTAPGPPSEQQKQAAQLRAAYPTVSAFEAFLFDEYKDTPADLEPMEQAAARLRGLNATWGAVWGAQRAARRTAGGERVGGAAGAGAGKSSGAPDAAGGSAGAAAAAQATAGRWAAVARAAAGDGKSAMDEARVKAVFAGVAAKLAAAAVDRNESAAELGDWLSALFGGLESDQLLRLFEAEAGAARK